MYAREDSLGSYEPPAYRRWRFTDRIEAGRRLGDALSHLRGVDPLVLGVPNGGVVVAAQVARVLDAPLKVIVASKVCSQQQPRLAVGAVAEDDASYLNHELLVELNVTGDWLEQALAHGRKSVREKRLRLRSFEPELDVAGRVVLLVDDGFATGATLRAAARCLRARKAKRIVAAVPVGAAANCDGVASEVDELVCLHRLKPYWALGVHYQTFEPVCEAEVLQALRDRASPRLERPVA